MDRRSSIKTLLSISIAAAVLPSCLQQERKASFQVKNFRINADEEDLITALCNTIIPKGQTPGAEDVHATQFVLLMMDDCSSPDDQQRFVKGLKDFDEVAQAKMNQSFVKANAAERNAFLEFLVKDNHSENLSYFYDQMKRLTQRAFTQSKYYLTEVREYQLVPGRFYGCVTVKNPN